MGVLKGIWSWFDDRTGLGSAVTPILKHKVPRTSEFDGWWYVLGSATLIAFIIQVTTGIALSTSYVSSTNDAYQSLQYITSDPIGGFLRGMHNWGASAMVLLIGLHALHVFLIASYKFPREMHWLSGVFLLLLTLAMAFTGQLLRWDDTAVSSVVVAAAQAGRSPFIGQQVAHFVLAGDTVGGATLSRFFSFHVFFIPAILFVLVGFHLYLVIRNGVSEPPKRGDIVDPKTYRQKYHDLLERDGVPFWPDAAWRDAAGALMVVIVVVILAVVIGPPVLGKAPDPTILTVYPKPDWYFLWYFSILALIPTQAESAVIIFGPLLAIVVMIALPFIANKGERNPLRRPWAVAITILILIMVGTLWIVGEQEPWSPKIQIQALDPARLNLTSQDGALYRGAQLFSSKGCVTCHIIEGYGGQKGPNLSYVANRYNANQLTYIIMAGRGGMPSYSANLTSSEWNDLLAFLLTRRNDNVLPTPQGSPAPNLPTLQPASH